MKRIIELKAKSVAENNFFDFTQTNDALAELSASLQNLENLLAVKSETAAKENKKQAQALKEATTWNCSRRRRCRAARCATGGARFRKRPKTANTSRMRRSEEHTSELQSQR